MISNFMSPENLPQLLDLLGFYLDELTLPEKSNIKVMKCPTPNQTLTHLTPWGTLCQDLGCLEIISKVFDGLRTNEAFSKTSKVDRA